MQCARMRMVIFWELIRWGWGNVIKVQQWHEVGLGVSVEVLSLLLWIIVRLNV